jgi:hypothetical protein
LQEVKPSRIDFRRRTLHIPKPKAASPVIGDTEPIRYRRPNPDSQFWGNILDEAMRQICEPIDTQSDHSVRQVLTAYTERHLFPLIGDNQAVRPRFTKSSRISRSFSSPILVRTWLRIRLSISVA